MVELYGVKVLGLEFLGSGGFGHSVVLQGLRFQGFGVFGRAGGALTGKTDIQYTLPNRHGI